MGEVLHAVAKGARRATRATAGYAATERSSPVSILSPPGDIASNCASPGAARLPLYGEKGFVMSLPAQIRRAMYERVSSAARSHGVAVRVCACKNSDVPSERCRTAGNWRDTRETADLPLFDSRTGG